MIRLARLALTAAFFVSNMSHAASPPQRLFVTGHSLVDQPLPSYLASIAASQGTAFQWNRQYVVGSSIRARTSGDGAMGWTGYRQGYNRDGEGLDVLSELLRPRTVSGGPYDTLVITEQHGLLGTLVWNDTVRHLRHYHDRFIDGNAAGRTWFYESWLSLDDKSDPRRWIAYERAASPVWQCLATRINTSLAAQGRADRIESLPAGAALAALIERSTQGAGLPPLSAGSVRQTVDRIVADDVHLTPVGSYYIALVTYAYLFGRAPSGAWAPPEVDAALAPVLQRTAWEVVEAERAARRPWSLAECQSRLQSDFIATYWAYVRDAFWKREVGSMRAWWRWAKHRVQWHWRLRANGPDNPLRYDAVTDKGYWLPAP
jgi:hypothetical protein